MSSTPDVSEESLPGYEAARGRLAHRFRAAGILDVAGEDRVAFLQGQLTQEMRGMANGEARPAAGLTSKGKLLFVARVLALEDRLRVVVPAQVRATVREHLRKYAVFTKVAIDDRSEDLLLVALYGPEAALAPPAGAVPLPPEGEFAAEWLAPSERRAEIDALLARAGSQEISEEAAEILRIEAGRPRFGRDADSNNLPDEVGLARSISATKGCYVGQEVVARIKTYGRVNRRLVAFRFPDGPVEPGEILRRPDETVASRTEAGRVTSAAISPTAGPIGLGFAFRDVSAGDRLVTERAPERGAIVSDLPPA